jgi:two-component system, OmpR family, sensor histidine kinase KdpD
VSDRLDSVDLPPPMPAAEQGSAEMAGGAGRSSKRRGTLRVYMGAAPGVGKTYDMLAEGHRRLARGADVVIGFVETHGREHTAELVEGLELVPRQVIEHRGASFTEMDLAAVLARRPEVALVDELAHTNVPGAGNPKRWQDVDALLDAGIDVVTTVNIQHLESLNDVVESITGIRQQETVPDDVVRSADQIELVDMSPQALRRRLAHGNVYSAEKIDAALTNFFRVGNLTALRELALLWVADRVDAALERYRADNAITDTWPARERVVVALTGGPEGETLIRRGARIADSRSGGELLALHVSLGDGLAHGTPDALLRQRTLVESLGGTFHNVLGEDIAAAILEFSRGVNASHIVIGETSRGPLRSALLPGASPGVIRGSGDIDVVVVTHHQAKDTSIPRRASALSPRRKVAGWVLAGLGPPLLALALLNTDNLSLVSLAMLGLAVAVALVGGLAPAVAAALIGGVALNYLFIEPTYTLTINELSNAAALLVMVAVAVAVAIVVDNAARRTKEAARARAEADTLTLLASSVLRGEDALPAMLERIRETFAVANTSLLQRDDPADGWRVIASSGEDPPTSDRQGVGVPVSDHVVLMLTGRDLSAEDTRVLAAVSAQIGTLLEREQLRGEASSAKVERARSDIRSSLLAAVSHDLRSPLAGIKACVGTLRAPDLDLPDADRAELLAGIETSADRLQGLIDNLLDMSRLDAGALVLRTEPVALDEVVPRALAGVPAERVDVDVRVTLPMVVGDAGLIERIIANLIENALRYSPPDQPVRVTAGTIKDKVVLRVVDKGPGVHSDSLESIFSAFQRLGDVPAGQGVGLGLAVSRGFAEANGGTLEAEETPGGGLTMVLTLQRAEDPAADEVIGELP